MPLPYCTHPIVVSHYSYCERLLSHLKKSIHCLQLQIISQRLQTGRRPIRVLCECGTSLKCEPRSAQRIASPRFGERAANIRAPSLLHIYPSPPSSACTFSRLLHLLLSARTTALLASFPAVMSAKSVSLLPIESMLIPKISCALHFHLYRRD